MARGDAFADRLSNWILKNYPDNLANLLVFVPTSRVAARVRARLSVDVHGVLPAILPMKGNGELADLLGFKVGAIADATAVQIEIARILRMPDGGDEAVHEPVRGERLWKRVNGLYRLLDRLALYGLTAHDLRRTVPVQMVGFWEVQAETLLHVSAHMERWLGQRGEVLAGGAERRVLEKAADVLAADDCPWVPVMAGILDGTPAAQAIAGIAAGKGRVLMPELGPVTGELVAAFETTADIASETLAGAEVEIREVVAETDWDEAWLAALGIKRAVDAGKKRVAVVSPSKILLRRVSGLLAQWGIAVPVSGELCMDHTPAGRHVLATRHWGIRAGKPADWLEAMQGYEIDAGIMTALSALSTLDAWLEEDDWRAVMALKLGETMAPVEPVSEGISLLGPLDARLTDFDVVIAAGAVEGTWPAGSGETWLSEAHLRALGLPDGIRKALLAGTEFESVMAGGSHEVILLRSKTVEGKETLPSRFIGPFKDRIAADGELPATLAAMRHLAKRDDGTLGTFIPEGALWPARWSASLTEAMLACPYKALGERVLRLAPPDPLTPEPDARKAGLLAHRWLERAGKEITSVTPDTVGQAVKRLLELAEFELRHEPPVVRAIWRAKFAKLAPALAAQWLADGRSVKVVEQRLKHGVGPVTVTATLDRVEDAGGSPVIIDFKTSTPPSWANVASGERPQLAIEAWLLGQDAPVADVEYWQLRGYGPNPLKVTKPTGKYSLDNLMAPVGEGLAKLVATYGKGAVFPAVPDMAGGGLMATGHCTRCELAGVCRRQTAAEREVAHG